MKYGETLQQRSIPAWSHHNIDYNDIKQVIKEQTTPGKGKTISVPGRVDDKLVQLENSLYAILADQHQRIDLFVRSKAGEIKRRLGHSQKQLKQLANRLAIKEGLPIPVSRLEKYGRLENDVIKAGDEIKSLARFTGIQRTAFRKLLKKYKKWTGSTQLEDRFRTEILNDPKGFTKLDLGPLLEEYSNTLQQVRTLYENRIRPGSSPSLASKSGSTATLGPSPVAQLQKAMNSGSKVEFDTAITTIPLGENGQLAHYFVHPENVVELQMLLLQHWRYYSTRSRSSSVAAPISSRDVQLPGSVSDSADCFSIAADDPDQFEREQNALTVDEREHVPGVSPQRIRLCARWNNEEDAQISSLTEQGKMRHGTMKRKHLTTFFNKTVEYPPNRTAGPDTDDAVQECRRDLENQREIRPLYKLSSCRSRFVGSTTGNKGAIFATLDTNIMIQTADPQQESDSATKFPFGVLRVRIEDSKSETLFPTLDSSHLLERVRGFSLEAHAVWETCKSSRRSPPLWLPILSRDIRKLPQQTSERRSSLSQGGSGAQSVTAGSSTTFTDHAITDCASPAINGTITFQEPPIRSYRKKRRRPYAEVDSDQNSQRYWSEYDHPEDMSDGGGNTDAYVIYIDPNEKSAFERMFDKIGGIFGRREPITDEECLPSTPNDDGTSSDEEETAGLMSNPRSRSAYGTIGRSRTDVLSASPYEDESPIIHSPISTISLIASLAILVTAYFLVLTSRRRLRYEVDAGVIFAMICSLLFAVVGFVALFRQPHKIGWLGWTAAGGVLIFDVIGTAGLLAWMLA